MANFLASGERLGIRLAEITPASGDVVTLAEAKKQANVTMVGDDDHIQLLINAAVEKFQQATGRQLLTRTMTIYLDTFPTFIKLPLVPFQTLTSVKYYDSAGTLLTLAASKYQVDDGGPDAPFRIFPGVSDVWPTTESARIRAVEVLWGCGYGAQAAVPDLIQHAIREMVAETYTNRIPSDKVGAATIQIPMHVVDIIDSFKVYDL